MRSHQWIVERSLALHEAVAARLEVDPQLLEVARANLKRWLAASPSVRQSRNRRSADIPVRSVAESSPADRNVRAPMPLGIHAPLASNFDYRSAAPLREWQRLLDTLPLPRLLQLLRSQAAAAARLRQSSPFAGILTAAERQAILSRYESSLA